jgi:hypothetical protein
VNPQERTVRVVMSSGCVYHLTPEQGHQVTTAADGLRQSVVLLNIPRRVLGLDVEELVPHLTLFVHGIASIES